MQYENSGSLLDRVSNIPGAFGRFNNWLMWMGELTSYGRYTKIPYQVDGSMMRASPTNPEQWAGMQQSFNAVNGLRNKGASECGMGFVITRETGLICIDLDDPQKCANPEKAATVQHAILEAFVGTYREKSPSGTGWHIWFYGVLPEGRDSMTLKSKAGIEVYAAKRFMTMTGDIANWGGTDVVPQNEQLQWLVALMVDINGGALPSPVADNAVDQDDSEALGRRTDLTDIQVINTCVRNNSVWNRAASGDLKPDKSENAQIVIGDIDKVTGSIEQIRRIFQMTPLRKQAYGDTPEAEIDRKFEFWIKRARADNQGILEKIEKGREEFAAYNERVAAEEAEKMQEEIAARNSYRNIQADVAKQQYDASAVQAVAPEVHRSEDGHFRVLFKNGPQKISEYATSTPPGVLTGIVQDIQHRVTQRASLDFAIAAAFGIFAGLCGHAYRCERVNGALYMLILGRSGQGKEAPETARSAMEHDLLNCGMKRDAFAGLGGQSNITSSQGLHRELEKQKTYYMIIGEGTEWLRNVVSTKTGPFADVKRYVLDLYGKNSHAGSVNPSKVVNKDNVLNRVHAPAMSLLLEGERSTYDEVLGDDAYLTSGFAARFIHVEGPDVLIPKNRNYSGHYSPGVINWLRSAIPLWQQMYSQQQMISDALNQADGEPPAISNDQRNNAHIHVGMTNDCYAHHYAFDDELDAFIHGLDSQMASVFNRLVPNVLRVAVLCAASVNPQGPVITKEIYLWAQEFVLRGLTRIKLKMEKGEVGSGDGRIRQIILEDITTWGKMTQETRHSVLVGHFPRKSNAVITALSLTRSMPVSVLSRRTNTKIARHNPGTGGSTAKMHNILIAMEQQGDISVHQSFEFNGVKFDGKMVMLPIDED